ncbi:uncharacterized protein LOC103795397 [Callithrix jacchus]
MSARVSPGQPRPSQLLPRAGGPAPSHGLEHVEEHLEPSVQKLREGGRPTWGSGEKSGHTGRSQPQSPSHLRAPGAADATSQGLWFRPPARGLRPCPVPPRRGPRAAHLPAALGACAPAPPLCSSSGQCSPRGPARPLGPLTPGAAALTFPAPPGPSRPAASSGPHPPRYVSGSSATLGARHYAPRACSPPRRGPQAAPAHRRAPLPAQAPPRVRTEDAQAARSSAGSSVSPSGRVESSAERSTHGC